MRNAYQFNMKADRLEEDESERFIRIMDDSVNGKEIDRKDTDWIVSAAEVVFRNMNGSDRYDIGQSIQMGGFTVLFYSQLRMLYDEDFDYANSLICIHNKSGKYATISW